MLPDKNSPALGRGLESLLGAVSVPQTSNRDTSRDVLNLNVADIKIGSLQPRRHFQEQELEELSQSIQQKGILQPLLVRPVANGYELIAGERRLRASKKAGLTQVPVLVKNLNDLEVLEIALIENIQRQDLSGIEEAQGFRRLMNEFNYTQEKISEIVGKSRSHIANTLRLLTLPESVQQMVDEGKLTSGHARTLINVNNAEEVAHKIIAGNLNVRQAESLKKQDVDLDSTSTELHAIQTQIQEALNLKVSMSYKKGRGEIRISFKDLGDLDHFLEKISV